MAADLLARLTMTYFVHQSRMLVLEMPQKKDHRVGLVDIATSKEHLRMRTNRHMV